MHDETACGCSGKRPFEQLVSRFWRFHESFCVGRQERFAELGRSQRPGAMVLSCCDSRTDPALLFACEPGDIFVHRTIAALVPPLDAPAGACVRASTCYAVEHLGVRDLVVLGHTHCGGMHGLVEGVDGTPLEDWISLGRPVLAQAAELVPSGDLKALQAACERLAPLQSERNLLSYPWIREGVESGRLTVHAWLFDLETGHLLSHNPETDSWEILPETPPVQA